MGEEKKVSIVKLIEKCIGSKIKFSDNQEAVKNVEEVLSEEFEHLSGFVAESIPGFRDLIRDYLRFVNHDCLGCSEGDSCHCHPEDLVPCGCWENLDDCFPTSIIQKEKYPHCKLGRQLTPLEDYACLYGFECEGCYWNSKEKHEDATTEEDIPVDGGDRV